jgi:uncharacterized protein HemX
MFGLSASDWTGIIQTTIIVGGTCYSFYKTMKKNITDELRNQNKTLQDSMTYQNQMLTDSINRLNDTIKSTQLNVDHLEVTVADHTTRIAVLEKVTNTAD